MKNIGIIRLCSLHCMKQHSYFERTWVAKSRTSKVEMHVLRDCSYHRILDHENELDLGKVGRDARWSVFVEEIARSLLEQQLVISLLRRKLTCVPTKTATVLVLKVKEVRLVGSDDQVGVECEEVAECASAGLAHADDEHVRQHECVGRSHMLSITKKLLDQSMT